jgi:hypothetical protein
MPVNQVVIADALARAIQESNPLPVTAFLIDSPSIDAFGRVRVSQPESRFDAQLTYDLQPLLYQQITAEAGATIAHSSVERAALMTFSNTPTGGQAYMQTYEHFYYQPGNSQQILITTNFIEHTANVTKFAGYGDLSNNGIHFISDGTNLAWRILSNTSEGDETALQVDWNLDKLNGAGLSGIILDITKTQILVIDLQALYTGRVRVGFNIGGVTIYCHEFLHANEADFPYLQTASLPIICGMTCTDTVSTTMYLICATVRSEGGSNTNNGFTFSSEGTVTAGSGARTHILSVRPKTTFNSIANREKFDVESIEILVTGNVPVLWELCLGQAISGTVTFNDVNTTYSAFEYNTAGTISGNPAIVIAAGYVAATAVVSVSVNREFNNRYPITLNVAGAVRSLGTLTLLVTGIGGTSATRATINHRELR